MTSGFQNITISDLARRNDYVRRRDNYVVDGDVDEPKSIGSLFSTLKQPDDPHHVYGKWHLLPDLLLEKICQHLTIRERYYISQVCSNWYECFSYPRVWYTFVLHDDLLTKRKYNYYSGWQKLLDHFRASIFLGEKGHHIRTLIFQPMNNLFNLYEFINISHYMNSKVPTILENVHTLRFHFACHLSQRSEELVFGTGGQLLTMIKKLLGILNNLQTLELNNFLLDGSEGLQLLDDVCITCCETLRTLVLINLTKHHHVLIHPGAFVNLETLIISPQNIGEDLLELIGNNKLRNFHIVQNKYTENGRSLYYKAWKECRRNNPQLRVHLRVEGNSKKPLLFQPRAPVKSIIYESPYIKISTPTMLAITELYNHDLEIFGHKMLPRFHMQRSFHHRPDSSLILLVRQCPYIHTMFIRELISTATVLLIAYTAKNLHYFYVRRNAVILKADWPRNPDWSAEFYKWLCTTARSYEAMEKEVSQILGYRWQTLTDKQYKMVNIPLEKPHYMFS